MGRGSGARIGSPILFPGEILDVVHAVKVRILSPNGGTELLGRGENDTVGHREIMLVAEL